MTASTATLDPAPSPTASAPAVVPLRVVIADDHPVYRDGIARALTDAWALPHRRRRPATARSRSA